jgi:hypothetical protein
VGLEDGGVDAGGGRMGGVKPLLMARWTRGLAPGRRLGWRRARHRRRRSSNDADLQATPGQTEMRIRSRGMRRNKRGSGRQRKGAERVTSAASGRTMSSCSFPRRSEMNKKQGFS